MGTWGWGGQKDDISIQAMKGKLDGPHSFLQEGHPEPRNRPTHLQPRPDLRPPSEAGRAKGASLPTNPDAIPTVCRLGQVLAKNKVKFTCFRTLAFTGESVKSPEVRRLCLASAAGFAGAWTWHPARRRTPRKVKRASKGPPPQPRPPPAPLRTQDRHSHQKRENCPEEGASALTSKRQEPVPSSAAPLPPTLLLLWDPAEILTTSLKDLRGDRLTQTRAREVLHVHQLRNMSLEEEF